MSRVGNPTGDPSAADERGVNYKWIALSNTTLGIMMVTINQSILLISLPALFRGIDLNPLVPSNTSYFLWVFMGFLLVTAVLVVSFGRVGDIYGRVKMYNLGFAIFTAFSILLSVTFLSGVPGVLWIIIMRVFQGVGGALLFANSSAILTDACPQDERGKAMGINGIAAVSGSFIGLILGGVLAPIEWRLGVLRFVPVRLFGTALGLLPAHGQRLRPPGQDRLAGQHAVRGRPDCRADRHCLLAAPLWRAPHRMDQPLGADRSHRRRSGTGPVRLGGDQGRGPDVPAQPVPDPG